MCHLENLTVAGIREQAAQSSFCVNQSEQEIKDYIIKSA